MAHGRLLPIERALRESQRNLAIANQELKRLALQDGLTGLANRRIFDQRIAEEWKRSRREQTPLSLIMADIDYFKDYNDIIGDHPQNLGATSLALNA